MILSLARRVSSYRLTSRPPVRRRRRRPAAAPLRRSPAQFFQVARFWALCGVSAGLIASVALPSSPQPKFLDPALLDPNTPSSVQQQIQGGQQATRQALDSLNQAIAIDRASKTLPPMFAGQRIDRVTLSSGEKVIALTFDDGPWATYTPQILDILKRYNAKGTFFVVGRQAQRYPDLLKRIAAEGHEFGNHTWTHRMRFADSATAANELDNTTAIIQRITGKRTRLYRPPGGTLNNGLDNRAKGLGYAVVMWSHDTFDWRQPPASTIVQRAIASPNPGNIVLMHDGGGPRNATVAALPQILNNLQQKGYRFVTIQELMAMKDAEKNATQPQAAPTTDSPASNPG